MVNCTIVIHLGDDYLNHVGNSLLCLMLSHSLKNISVIWKKNTIILPYQVVICLTVKFITYKLCQEIASNTGGENIFQ